MTEGIEPDVKQLGRSGFHTNWQEMVWQEISWCFHLLVPLFKEMNLNFSNSSRHLESESVVNHFFKNDQDLNGLTSGFCWSLVSLLAAPLPDVDVWGFAGNFTFLRLLVHVEQYQMNLGSLTFSLAKLGLWHSWWYKLWHSWHSTISLPTFWSSRLQTIQLVLVISNSSFGIGAGEGTDTVGATCGLGFTTGVMVVTGLIGTGAITGAFFWARHSSNIALSWSVASLPGVCNSCTALRNDVSKDTDMVG